MTDDIDWELQQLLRGDEVAQRLSDVIHREVMAPARELFGDRATSWIADTLRATADVLERIRPPSPA